MPSASPTSQCGSARRQPSRRLAVAAARSGSPQVRTVTLASSPPTGTSGSAGLGMRSSRSSSVGLDLGQLGVERVDPLAGAVEARLELGDLGAVGLGAAPDRLADPLRGRVALGLEAVALGQERRRRRVELERAVDERRVLALVDRALRGSRPAPRGAAAGRRSSRASSVPRPAPPAASRSRSTTKLGSRLASSQPARGPLGRPRKAR